MSMTARSCIIQAAKRLAVLAAQEALDDSEMVDCLLILNNMLFGFGPAGIQYVHVNLDIDDTVNVPDEQMRNIVLMLVDELSDEFSMPLSADQKEDVRNAKLELQAAYLVINPGTVDRALRVRWPAFFDFTRGS